VSINYGRLLLLSLFRNWRTHFLRELNTRKTQQKPFLDQAKSGKRTNGEGHEEGDAAEEGNHDAEGIDDEENKRTPQHTPSPRPTRAELSVWTPVSALVSKDMCVCSLLLFLSLCLELSFELSDSLTHPLLVGIFLFL
jgi:hypothetical protein